MESLHQRCLVEAPDVIAHASWQEFRWAVAAVLSRSFGLKQVLLEVGLVRFSSRLVMFVASILGGQLFAMI